MVVVAEDDDDNDKNKISLLLLTFSLLNFTEILIEIYFTPPFFFPFFFSQ